MHRIYSTNTPSRHTDDWRCYANMADAANPTTSRDIRTGRACLPWMRISLLASSPAAVCDAALQRNGFMVLVMTSVVVLLTPVLPNRASGPFVAVAR